MNPLNQAIFAHYRDSIAASQRPPVNITLQPSASLSVWQSKVGGVPYLPQWRDFNRKGNLMKQTA